MNIKLKHIPIIIILIGVILISYGASKKTDVAASYFAYINSILPRHLALSTDFITDYSSIQISQGYKIAGNPDENSRIYFVTNDRKYIGLLIVTCLDGVFHSSYGFDDNEIITNSIRDNISIAIFVLEVGALFIQTEYGNFLLSSFENLEVLPQYFPKEFNTSYIKSKIILNDVSFLN